VDDYVLPTRHGFTLVDALKQVDRSKFSSVIVPTVLPHRELGKIAGGNILQRWNLLGPDLSSYIKFPLRNNPQFPAGPPTPVGNPRHLAYSWVHWNGGRLKTFKEEMKEFDVLSKIGLHTVHAKGIARPHMDIRHGRVDGWYQVLGMRLDELLINITKQAREE